MREGPDYWRIYHLVIWAMPHTSAEKIFTVDMLNLETLGYAPPPQRLSTYAPGQDPLDPPVFAPDCSE